MSGNHFLYSQEGGFAFGQDFVIVSKRAFEKFVLVQTYASEGNCDPVHTLAKEMLNSARSKDAEEIGRNSEFVNYRIQAYSQGKNREIELRTVRFRLDASIKTIESFLVSPNCAYGRRTHDFYSLLFFYMAIVLDREVWFMSPSRALSLDFLDECAVSDLFDKITSDPFYLPKLDRKIPAFEYYGIIESYTAAQLKQELQEVLPLLAIKYSYQGDFFMKALNSINDDQVLVVHHAN